MGYGGAKMKKITKKIISLAICAIMVFGTISVGGVIDFKAFAATSGSCGVYLTWSYNSDTNELVISGTGEMTSSPWDYYEDKITKVTIDDGVTNIGTGVFYRCTKLTSVTIGNSVTSIGDYAFRNCTGLTSITIPDSVKSIGDNAFENCTRLASITIPDSVTTIGDYAFRWTGYYNDEDNWQDGVLYIGNYLIEAKDTISGEYKIKDGTKVIADYAFYYCISLKSITIPDSVTSIGDDAFRGCTGLTSITIPDSVTSIGGGAFYGCTGLTSITIPDSVTSIGNYAFSGCTGLTSITISNSVTRIGQYAFSGCTGLKSITIGNSVTSIGCDAFYGCKGLTSVTIPNSVTSIESYVFSGCTRLTEINVDNNSEKYCSIDGVLFSKDKTEIVCYPVGKTDTSYSIPDSVMSIAEEAFRDCKNLTSITIGNSVTSIGSCAFVGTGLTSVKIPSTVTSIGGRAFGYNEYAVNGFTIYCENGSEAQHYANFNKFTCILSSSGSNDSYYSKGSCGNGVDYILYANGELVINGSGAITSSPWDGYSDNIYKVTIGNGVTSICDEAFYNCQNLYKVTIGNGVRTIGSFAFCGTGLTEVTIPSTVTNIGIRAFSADYWTYKNWSLTIYCEEGSVAQQYAEKNEIYYVNVRDASTKDNSSSLSFFQRIIAFFKNIFNSIKNLFL